MEPTEVFASTHTSIIAFKAVFGLIGLACVGMGYRLFVKGIVDGGAAIRADVGAGQQDNRWVAKVLMGRGGPGLVFAFFGMAVIVATLLRPTSVELTQDAPVAADAVEAEPVDSGATSQKPKAEAQVKSTKPAPKTTSKQSQQKSLDSSLDLAKLENKKKFHSDHQVKIRASQQHAGGGMAGL